MRSLFIKLIIYWGLRHEQRFLRLLARLEYGVSIFCKKLSSIAKAEGHHNLATMLDAHAASEEPHGKMLASLVDGSQRLTKTEEKGRWVSVIRVSTGESLTRINPDPESKGKRINWDSYVFAGERIEGVFENFDGLSLRYLSLRLLFGGRKAYEFEWRDRLAFMYVLETGTRDFYKVLHAGSESESLKAIALQISNDEIEHSNYLHNCLCQFSHFPYSDIEKWNSRVDLALLGLVVDACSFL